MHLTIYFLALFFAATLAAPIPNPPFKEGDIVGVRPGEYEEGPKKGYKDVSIHPGVVMGPPHPVTGKFPVAMISSKLPNNPPQGNIKDFYHGSGLEGNIRLDTPKEIGKAKPWKHKETGEILSPMNQGGMQKLREAMANSRQPPAGPSRQSHDNTHASGPAHVPHNLGAAHMPHGQAPSPPHDTAQRHPALPVPAHVPHDQGAAHMPHGQAPSPHDTAQTHPAHPHNQGAAHINQVTSHGKAPSPHDTAQTHLAHPHSQGAAHINQMTPHGQAPSPPHDTAQRHPNHPSLPPPATGGKGKQPIRGKR